MVGKEECMEIWVLKRQGYSNRAIAQKLGAASTDGEEVCGSERLSEVSESEAVIGS